MPLRSATGTTILVMVVVAIIVVAMLGYVILSSPLTPGLSTVTSSTAQLMTSPSASATSSSGTSTTTICNVSAYPFGIVLQVLSDSGSPIQGVEVTGETLANYCGGQQTNQLPSSMTNSTGWVSFLEGYPGSYELTVSYSGNGYNVTVPTTPTFATYATFMIPSGNLTTSLCYANVSCLGSTSSSESTQQSLTCVISGQPGDMFLRVISDSNQTPVGGARVTATNEPASCGSAYSTVTVAANTQTTVMFTTRSSAEWYPLSGENNAGYMFVVTYEGQTYSFTALLRPLSATCATLYLPSGNTNVSIEGFQTSCASTSTSSTS